MLLIKSKGQEAQALVLGKDAALQLAALEKVLEAARENDRIVKVADRSVHRYRG